MKFDNRESSRSNIPIDIIHIQEKYVQMGDGAKYSVFTQHFPDGSVDRLPVKIASTGPCGVSSIFPTWQEIRSQSLPSWFGWTFLDHKWRWLVAASHMNPSFSQRRATLCENHSKYILSNSLNSSCKHAWKGCASKAIGISTSLI